MILEIQNFLGVFCGNYCNVGAICVFCLCCYWYI